MSVLVPRVPNCKKWFAIATAKWKNGLVQLKLDLPVNSRAVDFLIARITIAL
jgi:hypothetical protein